MKQCRAVLIVCALVLPLDIARAQPPVGTAMTSPIAGTFDQMQESFRTGRQSAVPVEWGSGDTAIFYPGTSGLTPAGRAQLARSLSRGDRYDFPNKSYYCNVEVQAIAFWNSDPSVGTVAKQAAQDFARQRLKVLFRWFVEHGYDRSLLIGWTEELRAGEKEDEVFYQIGGGFFPAHECEKQRQKERNLISNRRSGFVVPQ
ncbi:MAG: hypothetical protein EOO38_08490 [Cytophagaceae bacterium]|nr:MAG: hypothetical protein EOO38_08490 [Cytophagaceae bacterium]